MDREAFGTRLRALRHRTGISQAEAARAAQVAEGSWRRWEHSVRVPRITDADRIARAIGVEPGSLFARSVDSWLGEIVLSPATLEQLRKGGPAAVDEVAERLSQALKPRLRAMAQKPLNDGPPRARNARRKRSRAEVYEQLAQAARRRADREAARELGAAGGGGGAREEP